MQLVFASNNLNKIKEIQSILNGSIQLLSLSDIGCHEEIPETAATIEGNAILKANYVTEKYGYDCFADDTGLEVNELNGEPGVYSARYAGEQRDANDNMNKLLDALQGKEDRSAHFKTVIALNLKGEQNLFTGIAKGTITKKKAGDHGFGYDPIFQPENYSETFAELASEIKNTISHRAKATQQLIDFLNSEK
ncbi:non-canonical purine NTP diphosphatase [Flavobacterium hercynium]|uniref:dITP/XTP pyrophosphatase n=1 Tax=Flavobacterium hercynium TaxID=387094 RepID=A0A226GYQ1_9FLAO|nr:non-canonical purine NTP diphosphatase [Flavobacterium hercynium]OXA86400.1 non-canonical purine NTP pyrophosphatase [Flavobacterium hercynium]SMP17353.1 XTP/dITP diphosphohydrolase [Flavobacterium hercynium]